jgi:dihydrofolate synthase / folylpolyglutamate synthase
MNFDESQQYLFSLGNEVSTMKLGLENIRTLLAALGNPQNNYLKVQVAGTNGKGSVCAFLDSICNTVGIKTGTFTSPHLVTITERIRINGHDISEDDFARHSTRVRETADVLLAAGNLEFCPTFFEQITAIALIAFVDASVEIAILETGLGGRLDATTAANAEIAAITRIDLDHQEYLGETIQEIAAEKAAIIHSNSKVVVGKQDDDAMSVISSFCSKLGIVPTTEYETAIWAVNTLKGSADILLRTKNELYDDLDLGLSGRHQIENARIAVLLSEVITNDFGFHITVENVLDGLEQAHHFGRLEYTGRFLYDGAHNVGGAKALAAYLDEFEKRPITIIFGSMREKNVAEILKVLAPLATKIVFTEGSNIRSLSYYELLELLPADVLREGTFATDNVTSAIDIAETITPEDGIILVTGSLYLVGDVKKILSSQI